MSAELIKMLYQEAEAQILREVARRAALRPSGQPATAKDLAAMRRYTSRLFASQRAQVRAQVRRTVDGTARQADLIRRLTTAERTAATQAGELLRTGGRPARLVGLVDRAGRRWSLSGYTEVAARATAARVELDRQLTMLRRNGVTHVRVTAALGECEKCMPWDGRTLTLAQLDGAIRAGLKHINCRCKVSRA